ncbi:shikimate kinase [Balneola vulgaris]|jgi:shikimate kinase|uniref:shikimate kinase n=1 Tax=Balneola vulgaris TaxID=287535 RepID=UPI0008FBF44E|nr:shikimate kinase [Balneola vulgaris]
MNEHRLKKFDGNFFLCGFMGAGKSTLGRALAQRLGEPFLDLDKYIEAKEYLTIPQIFNTKGEEYFREVEQKCAMEVAKSFKGVVALGGGTLQSQFIIDHLKLHGLLIYLELPLEDILDRISKNKNRPILLNEAGELKSKEILKNELNTLYLSRLDSYNQAQIKLKVNGYDRTESLAEALIEKIKQHV